MLGSLKLLLLNNATKSNLLLSSIQKSSGPSLVRFTSGTQWEDGDKGPPEPGPKRWPLYNKKVFPPQEIGEERRPSYVCHMNLNFKYSPEKMWYIACLVRGMTIDEAIRQVSYINRKGAWLVKKTLLEAQDLAVEKHNVEFRSNLWVAESFVGKGLVIKGLRRHARKKTGIIHYRYCHYFVRLEEGSPPDNIYPHQPKFSGPRLLEEFIAEHRKKRMTNTY